MSTYDGQGDIEDLAVPRARPITLSRITNVFLMFWYAALLVIHVVCLAVLAAKHSELVDKFNNDPAYKVNHIKESCILFIDYNHDNGDSNNPSVNWVNNKCHLVIYGSGALGGCALLMILFLTMRTLLFRKINFLVTLDAIEVVLTGLFAFALAVIITLGKNETCKSIEDLTSDLGYRVKCEDFYLPSSQGTTKAQLYNALRTAQVASWISVGVIGIIGMMTLIRVIMWFVAINRRRHASVELDPPLTDHDQLGSPDYSENLPSYNYNRNDDNPLYP